jgi:hypothetical protein
MTKRDRIQYLLITHLLREGNITLVLPDGIVLELGITKEGKNGRAEICNDYCWVVMTQDQRRMFMDSYNLSLQYADDGSKVVLEDDVVEDDGDRYHVVDVV